MQVAAHIRYKSVGMSGSFETALTNTMKQYFYWLVIVLLVTCQVSADCDCRSNDVACMDDCSKLSDSSTNTKHIKAHTAL